MVGRTLLVDMLHPVPANHSSAHKRRREQPMNPQYIHYELQNKRVIGVLQACKGCARLVLRALDSVSRGPGV